MRNKVNYNLIDDANDQAFVGCTVKIGNYMYYSSGENYMLFDAFDDVLMQHEDCTGEKLTYDHCELYVIETEPFEQECFV